MNQSQITIPKRFLLFGMTIEVVMVDDLVDTEGYFGKSDFNKNEIFLQSPLPGIVNEEQFLSCFFHELVHTILYHIGHAEYESELLASGIGGLLHQAFSTFSYE